MNQADKTEKYRAVAREIAAVTAGEANRVANMATISCLLSQAFEHYFWTGFYCVDPIKPTELVVGPYQGTLGCLRIAFTKGVCGTAAATGKTQIVEDVHNFPGHIACDSQTMSEIVVPVFDKNGKLMAVLDVDSTEAESFDAVDQKWLEQIMRDVFGG